MKLLILAALAAAFAFADPIATTQVTLTGVNGASVDGFYTSPYSLSVGGADPIAVFCDDFLDEVSIGETWSANIFAGDNLAGAYFSLSDPDYVNSYNRMFYLADQSSQGLVDPVAASQAIWQVEDSVYAGSAASDVLLAQSVAGAGTVNPADFIVIDGVNPLDPGRPQSFIAQVSPAATPEPSTWLLIGSGLIGVAFIRRRRLIRS